MAFNQFQIDELNKIEGFGKAYEKGSVQAAKVAGDIALLMIPGLGTIKLARSGGKLTQSAMEFVKRARKMYPKSKINGNPTAKQIAEAKPMGSVKLKTPTQVAANVQKSRPRATPQGGKPTTIKDKPRAKPDTKTVEKAPPKPAAPGLAKNRKPVAPKPKANVKSTRKLADDVKAAAAKRAAQARMRRAEKVKGPAKKAAAAAGIVGAGIALDKVVRPKKSAAVDQPRKTSGPTTRGSLKPPSKNKTRVTKEGAASKRMPTIKSEDRAKDSAVSPKPNQKKTSPKVDKSAAASKRMPTVKKPTPKVDKSAAASKRMPKRTNITAGPNTGFGPKGNIFPKNAEDRNRLMDLYGGTGSRAAKAAAAGTQGTLKKRK